MKFRKSSVRMPRKPISKLSPGRASARHVAMRQGESSRYAIKSKWIPIFSVLFASFSIWSVFVDGTWMACLCVKAVLRITWYRLYISPPATVLECLFLSHRQTERFRLTQTFFDRFVGKDKKKIEIENEGIRVNVYCLRLWLINLTCVRPSCQ